MVFLALQFLIPFYSIFVLSFVISGFLASFAVVRSSTVELTWLRGFWPFSLVCVWSLSSASRCTPCQAEAADSRGPLLVLVAMLLMHSRDAVHSSVIDWWPAGAANTKNTP